MEDEKDMGKWVEEGGWREPGRCNLPISVGVNQIAARQTPLF